MATQYLRRTSYSKEDFDKKPTIIPDYGRPTTKKRMCLEKAKDERAGRCDKAGMKSPSPLQDQKNCQDIHGKEADDKIEDNFYYEDSWSSDEGEGISVEELKQTEGYQLFKEALQAHAKNSAKSVFSSCALLCPAPELSS